MADPLPNTSHGRIRVLKLVLAYAGFAALWILFSDRAVAVLFSDPAQIIRASMFKGWAFVAVTSLLLYVLVRRFAREQQEAHRREVDTYRERQRSLELLSAIADNSADAIFAKDTDGRYLLFNQAAGRFVGKPAAAVIGQDDRALFPPAQAAMIMELDRRTMLGGRVESHEETLDTALGTRTFLATKGPLRDAAGRIYGIFGISRDITADKAAAADLLSRNAELEQFNRASIGRELGMIELKKQVNALAAELGRAPPHDLSFLDAPAVRKKEP